MSSKITTNIYLLQQYQQGSRTRVQRDTAFSTYVK